MIDRAFFARGAEEGMNRDLGKPPRRILIGQRQESGLPTSSHSRSIVLTHTPYFPILGIGGYDGPQGLWDVSQPGYEWSPGPVAGGTGSGYAQPTIWFGRRTGSAPSKTISAQGGGGSGTGYEECAFVEMPGLLGEVLWSGQVWGTSTSMTVAAMKRGLAVPGALLLAVSRFKSGGAGGGSVVLSNGQAPILALMGNLTLAWIFRYIPGSRPSAAFGFARSTASSALLAVIR